MATPQDATKEEAIQLLRIKSAKHHYEVVDGQAPGVDHTKIQEWSLLVIAEQLIQIKYELTKLREQG
jgi:hypothetical protein